MSPCVYFQYSAIKIKIQHSTFKIQQNTLFKTLYQPHSLLSPFPAPQKKQKNKKKTLINRDIKQENSTNTCILRASVFLKLCAGMRCFLFVVSLFAFFEKKNWLVVVLVVVLVLVLLLLLFPPLSYCISILAFYFAKIEMKRK